MRLLVTRPREDSEALMAQLVALGHEPVASPLLEIRVFSGNDLNVEGVQALLFTSANGVRAFAMRCAVRSLPALCVGDATAREAKAQGFQSVNSASGDVVALSELVVSELEPEAGTLLHPAGSKVAGDLAGMVEAAGFQYRREVLYEAIKAMELADTVQSGIRAGNMDGVLLFSPRTGAAFAQLVDKAGLREHLTKVRAFCLSDAVVEQIQGLPWKSVRVAERPDQASLLAVLDT